MREELVYRGDSSHTYAMSIAATWVWAPAIFVASNMAYYSGLYGFLWFLIPNFLTLILFGYFAQKFVLERGKEHFVGLTDLFVDNKKQESLHSIVSVMLLVASTCVQILGLHALLQIYVPDISLLMSACLISIFCYLYTKMGGIKACIVSDKYKYILMLLIGLLLVWVSYQDCDVSKINVFGLNNPSFIDVSLSFGIISAIGHFGAPYVDNTFWQRVFSLKKDEVFSTFVKSALYFLLIPLCFGLVGFFNSPLAEQGWIITKAFEGGFTTACLSVAIFCALIATIDSNLCAIHSLAHKTVGKIPAMELLLCISVLVVSYFEPTIVQMFLIYGTVRTATSIPTVLIIYDKFDKERLFWATLCAVMIGGVGYVMMALNGLPYGFIFTIFALLCPLIGFKK